MDSTFRDELCGNINANNDCGKTTYRMPPNDDLEMLMARYQQGDGSAAAALVHQLSPQLHRFFAAQLPSRGEADDLLQETWLRIHKVRHTYRPGEPALPWFYAIARHIRVDHYRKATRRASDEWGLEKAATTAAGPESLVDADSLSALLAPLPPAERDVVEMLKVAGMSLEEVARATSSTVGSVKQRAHRAYKRLRSAWGSARPGSRQSGEQV